MPAAPLRSRLEGFQTQRRGFPPLPHKLLRRRLGVQLLQAVVSSIPNLQDPLPPEQTCSVVVVGVPQLLPQLPLVREEVCLAAVVLVPLH